MADDRLTGPFLTPDEIRMGFALDELPPGWRGPHRFHISERPQPRIVHTETLDYDELVADVRRWEGFVPHMYLCSRGVVTVGIGNALFSVEAAKAMPFMNADMGKPATADEIANAYDTVSSMRIGKVSRGTAAYARTALQDPAESRDQRGVRAWARHEAARE